MVRTVIIESSWPILSIMQTPPSEAVANTVRPPYSLRGGATACKLYPSARRTKPSCIDVSRDKDSLAENAQGG